MKFKENVSMATDDFWYDFFEGYIIPEELLENQDDVDAVLNAKKILEDFYKSADMHDMIQ